MTSPTPIVRQLVPADEARWRELFREYRAFYLLPESEEIVTRAWGWFMDPGHTSQALGAELDGELVGFAHHRPVVAPSLGMTARFLDDLFTDPAVRGRGVGRALITRLREIAAEEGSGFVQWVTAEDNIQAQALYNTVAARTSWVTYEATPAA